MPISSKGTKIRKNKTAIIISGTTKFQQNFHIANGIFSIADLDISFLRVPVNPVAPTGVPGTNYANVISTPVPNYLIGNSLGATTYTFSVTNGTGATLYTNGTYTVSASSVSDSAFGHQIINLFNGINGGGYQEWQTAPLYTGARVSNCTTYAGTTSTIVNSVTYLGEWCQIQLPYSISVTRFKYLTFNGEFGRIALVGSNNGTNWTSIYVEVSNINNGGGPAGNGNYTTISTPPAYFLYVRLIALVGQNVCANPVNLILQGNVNIGNTTPGYIATATYGTVTGTSITINLTGTYTSFNVVRTNITAGNTIKNIYGLVGTTYVDSTVSSLSIFSYSIVPVNYNVDGNAFSVGSVTTPPVAPTGFVLSSKTNTTMTFSFTPSSGTGITYTVFTTNITGYSATGSSSPITLTNLQPGTSYTIVARATNSFGTSANSNSVIQTTTTALPLDVTGLARASRADKSAVISFNSSNNATSYTIYVNGVSNVVGTSSPLTLTGLTPLITYQITIKATNIYGSSNESSSIELNTLPSPPTNLVFFSDPSGNSFAVLTFTKSSGNISQYTATLNTGQVSISQGNFGDLVFYGLQTNTPYTATIVAKASNTTYGSSLPSVPISFTIISSHIFSGSLSTFNGWQNFGANSYDSVNGSGIKNIVITRSDYANIPKYCYVNLSQSLLGKTIQFNAAGTDFSRIIFGCNINGLGNVLRIGSSSSSTETFFTNSTEWKSISTPVQKYTSLPSNYSVFNQFKIVISNTGVLTYYVNNVLREVISGSYIFNESGYYFGFTSDLTGNTYYNSLFIY